MRRLLRCVALALVWIVPGGAGNDLRPVRLVAVDTNSPIRITAVHLGVKREGRLRRLVGDIACVSFENRSSTDVTQVTFHFVYYDTRQDHAADNELGRTGRFSPGVTIAGSDEKTHTLNLEDCVDLPDVPHDVALAVVFVTHVTSVGSVNWASTGPAVPMHLGRPDPAPSPVADDSSPAADATP